MSAPVSALQTYINALAAAGAGAVQYQSDATATAAGQATVTADQLALTGLQATQSTDEAALTGDEEALVTAFEGLGIPTATALAMGKAHTATLAHVVQVATAAALAKKK